MSFIPIVRNLLVVWAFLLVVVLLDWGVEHISAVARLL